MLQNWILGCTPGSDSSLPLQNGTLPPSCPSRLTLSTYNCLLSSGSQQVTVTAGPLCVRDSGRSRHMDPERERTAPSRRRSQRPKGTERGVATTLRHIRRRRPSSPRNRGWRFPYENEHPGSKKPSWEPRQHSGRADSAGDRERTLLPPPREQRREETKRKPGGGR